MANALSGQLIIFSLAGNLYGLDVTIVQEILPKIPLRTIPKSAAHLRGLIDFRGQIVPLINLRSLLMLPDEQQVQSVIVILVAGKFYSIMVDGVKEVLGIDDKLELVSDFETSVPTSFVSGCFRVKEEIVVALREDAIIDMLRTKEDASNAE